MKPLYLLIFFFTSFTFYIQTVNAQRPCTSDQTYGSDFGNKNFYRNEMTGPSTNPATIPSQIWKRINSQIDSLTNGVLRKKIVFNKVYVIKDGVFVLFDWTKPALTYPNGNMIFVQYRLVYDLVVNKTMKITFGIDVDEYGRIIYLNDLPLINQKKFPGIQSCSAAIKTALTAKKEIKSFATSSLYYDPVSLKFLWKFSEEYGPDIRNPQVVVVDAISGKILAVQDLATPIIDLPPQEEMRADSTSN